MKRDILKLVVFGLVLSGVALCGGTVAPAPEIDPGTIAVPLTLIGGAVLIIRSRIRQ